MNVPSDAEILALLAELDQKTAGELDSEVLDFKPWQDAKESKKVAIEYTACLANTHGGVIVFGVKDLIACEPKKDLGADAIAKSAFSAEGEGKILACSITAELGKVRNDAKKIKDHYKGIDRLIFATPAAVSNEKGEAWAVEIQQDFGYQLAIMSRQARPRLSAALQ